MNGTSKGNFNIQFKDFSAEVKNIAMYDNIGRLMQTISNVKSLDIINVSVPYSASIYFVRTNTEKGFAVKKVVIE